MGIKFYPGFTACRKGAGPSWVAVHAGPGFDFPDSRDEKTDVIAGLCWKRLGGSLVLSNSSRSRSIGVDFNRSPPPMSEAISIHKVLEGGKINQDDWYDYRLKYAWTAADSKDHMQRLGIYKKFWQEVGKSGTVVVMHRMFGSPKTAGSVMDVFSRGFDEKKVKSAVLEVNRRHGDFFKEMGKDFADYLLMEERRRISFVKLTPPQQLEKEFVVNMKEHMRILGVREMNEIIPAFQKHLGKARAPVITVERLFDGSLSTGLKNLSREKRILQVEVTSFLCNWYPDKASEMICGVLEILEREGR
jgi:hypothetical protein